MGEVVPLIERVQAAGDWTPVERDGLQALAEQYATDHPELEVVFGRTDEGDPWCVIKDLHDEILVHVARIASRFVLHSVPNDDIAESDDLLEMLRGRIAALDLQLGKVLPFGRDGHVLTALVIVTALQWETQPLEEREPESRAPQARDEGSHLAATIEGGPDDADAGSLPAAASTPGGFEASSEDAAARLPSAPQVSSQLTVALAAPPRPDAGSSDGEPASFTPPSALSPVEASAPAPFEVARLVQGIETGEQFSSGPGAASVQGRSGADSLRAAGETGDWNWLNGGDGEDRIELATNVVATGGPGADTFVVQAPAESGSPTLTLLGVISDFTPEEGDKVESDRGPVVTWTPDIPPVEAPPALPATVASEGYLVVDVDGDGRGDGYLILAQAANEAGANTPGAASPSPDQAPEPVTRSELPGMSLDTTGLW